MSLEEKRFAVKQRCEESKVLYVKADALDLNVMKYVHQIHSGIFTRYV